MFPEKAFGGEMLIHMSDASLVESLEQFLARCECRPKGAGRATLYVSPPVEQYDREFARLQLDGYLRAWCSMHPGVSVTLDGDGPPPELH
jgi:hypothetical protein